MDACYGLGKLRRMTTSFWTIPNPFLPSCKGLKFGSTSSPSCRHYLTRPPKYAYPMEWDNLAVPPVSTFEQWWMHQIGFKARNKAKQAERKGIVLREVPFDDALVRGIWEICNECPVR